MLGIGPAVSSIGSAILNSRWGVFDEGTVRASGTVLTGEQDIFLSKKGSSKQPTSLTELLVRTTGKTSDFSKPVTVPANVAKAISLLGSDQFQRVSRLGLEIQLTASFNNGVKQERYF